MDGTAAFSQQLARFGLNPEDTAHMAGVMVGNGRFRFNRFWLPASLMNEELTQFVGFCGQLFGPFVPIRPGFQQVGIFDPNHGDAGAARQDNGRIRLKDFNGAFGQGNGLGPKTAVEERLTAAGLFVGKGNCVTGYAEQFDC
jgi:hypothetical protein